MGEPHTTAPNSGSPSLEADRRGFLGGATVIAMCGGLAAGYGTFLAFAGRFLFPDASKTNWLFVDRARAISPGGSVAFTTPNGNAVVVKRSADAPDAAEPLSEDFVALSSTCPHLGCRVHWEPQNDRFFCPCHNGAFDSQGRPTEGPPLAANQHLPRYPLRIEDGLLFIGISGESVTAGNETTFTVDTMEAESPGPHAPEARPRLENET